MNKPMKDTARQLPEIPESAQECARELASEAFATVGGSLKQMARELEEFNQRRSETREKINRGARRTSRRIV